MMEHEQIIARVPRHLYGVPRLVELSNSARHVVYRLGEATHAVVVKAGEASLIRAEFRATVVAGRLGLSPAPHMLIDDGEYAALVRGYASGTTVLDLHRSGRAVDYTQALVAIETLHSRTTRESAHWPLSRLTSALAMGRMAEDDRLAEFGDRLGRTRRQMMGLVTRAAGSVRTAGSHLCLIHGDLGPEQMLQGPRATLIDWEYASQGLPMEDWSKWTLLHRAFGCGRAPLVSNMSVDLLRAWEVVHAVDYFRRYGASTDPEVQRFLDTLSVPRD